VASTRNRPLPESYRHLNEFAVRYPAGSTVYEPGPVLDRFFVVLSGRVRLGQPIPGGQLAPLGDAVRGQLIGHLPAFNARPALTVATTVDDSVLIAVPIAEAAAVFSVSPDLAAEIARDLAARVSADPASEVPDQPSAPEPAATPPPPPSDEPTPIRPPAPEVALPPESAVERGEPEIEPGAAEVPAASAIGSGWAPALTKLDVEFDDSFFFKDQTDCPACGSRFEYLRVRTAGVRPQHRDSDFYVAYRSEDPTRYGIVVCPTCSFAATHDDFGALDERERTAIVGARQQRGRYDYPNLGGLRTLEESLIAVDLAQSCYALRPPSERRDAVLLHRRAWIERERGDEAAERDWLEQARDAYRRSFELDGEISEESAMRVAYLIGDLSLRLGDLRLGAQWLETATRFPEAKAQSGLERLARDRLSDARKLLSELEAEQESA
jgi:uncharacterized protein (DUF2225 family)